MGAMGCFGQPGGEDPRRQWFGAETWLTSGRQATHPRQTACQGLQQEKGRRTATGGRARQPVGSAAGSWGQTHGRWNHLWSLISTLERSGLLRGGEGPAEGRVGGEGAAGEGMNLFPTPAALCRGEWSPLSNFSFG